MTTVTDEDVQQRDDGAAIGEQQRRLVALHFEGFDLEAFGLRYHVDGGGFDLGRGPSDSQGLTALLGRATAVLRRLGRAVRSEATSVAGELQGLEQRAEERVHRWFARMVRHLVRYALGRLAQLAARKIRDGGQPKKAKAAAPSTAQRRSRGRRAAPAEGDERRGGAAEGEQGRGSHARPQPTRKGPGGRPQRRGKVAQTARKTVRELPREQTARLARGLAPQESAGIAAQLHVGDEEAAPFIRELEDAAKELVAGSAS